MYSIEFYTKAFGLTEFQRFEFETFTLVYLRDPHTTFELELTQNHNQEEPYQLGNGYGHLALQSQSLESDRERVQSAGGDPTEIKSLDYEGQLLGRFFFATDPDGYKIEVLAKEGRFAKL